MKQLTIGILAHVDAGKTTLSEGLLFTSGTIRKLGRVDKQDAFLDTDAMERQKGITIFSKQARMDWGEMQVTLLDTPGHVDFSAEMERTLQVLDYAILVVSGADGVQSHTRTVWRLLKQYDIPVFIFVNKMDQEGTSQGKIMEALQKELDSGCIAFSKDAAEGNLVSIGEDLSMLEEDLLERYLESGEIPDHEDVLALIEERKLFPCMFGSALKMDGVDTFLGLLQNYMEAPAYETEFGARVFKITRDEQGNRLTHLKVTGGALKVKDVIEEEKINQIRLYNGLQYDPVSQMEAGGICAVTGLENTYPGQGLGAEEGNVSPVLSPVLRYRVILPEDVDALQMLPKLRLLEEEDPLLKVEWEEKIQEIQVQVMGEIQIEVLKNQIARRFGVDVVFGPGHIVYKETITASVEGVGHFEPLRHYAEVHLLLEPGEMGSGLQFATAVSEDDLAKNWQRLILTHLKERRHLGTLMGVPVTDMKITLVAGRAHLKHTEGGDFRQATYRAIRNGLMQALAMGQTRVLEPYYSFRLEIPMGSVGRAMTDLEQRFAHFVLEHSGSGADELAVITGSAPAACLQAYQKEVASYTRGLGNLSFALLGYGPCHNEEEVLAEHPYDPEADLRNTPDSVFCSHGAGVVIPWYQVPEHMHVDSGLGFLRAEKVLQEQENLQQKRGGSASPTFVGTDEIDAILNRTFHANRKENVRSRKRWGIKKSVTVAKPSGSTQKQVRNYQDMSFSQKEYLLVDGYNVIFAWKKLHELAQININSARDKLQDILCNYQGFRKCELILVFDAYKVQGHDTEYFDFHNIHIVYTKTAETADAYIERFAHEHASKYRVTVVTSDGLEQIIIRGQGAALISSREFEQEVAQMVKQGTTQYQQEQPLDKRYLLDGISEEILSELKAQSED